MKPSKNKIFIRTLTLVFAAVIILSMSITANATNSDADYTCDNFYVNCYEADDGSFVTEVVHACDKVGDTDLYVCQSEKTEVSCECSICGKQTSNKSVSFCDSCAEDNTKTETVNRITLVSILNFLFRLFYPMR